MKTLQNIFIVLIIGINFPLFGQNSGKDTTFIFKDTVDGVLQTIFIDYNKESQFYNNISDFSFQTFDNESYRNSIDYLKENKQTLIHAKTVIPWSTWVTLEQYKGAFYVYHPCDFLFHFRQSVNDSTFIDWTGEGPVANKIIEQKKIDLKTYEFKLTGINDLDRKIVIHIIDIKKGIAVFEQTVNGTDKRYYLMIASDKINSVPIIVNHCPTQKQLELEFDKVNFEQLCPVLK